MRFDALIGIIAALAAAPAAQNHGFIHGALALTSSAPPPSPTANCNGWGSSTWADGCAGAPQANNYTFQDPNFFTGTTGSGDPCATGNLQCVKVRADVAAPPGGPVVSTLPTATGSSALNGTLTLSQGTWTNSPTSYRYLWERLTSNSARRTQLATTASYQTNPADQGQWLIGTVTATNASGSATAIAVVAVPMASAPHVAGTSGRQKRADVG